MVEKKTLAEKGQWQPKKETFDCATPPKQQKVAYGYDAFNNLISRDLDSNGDGTVDQSGYFIYDNGQVLLQLDSTGEVDQRLLWGSAVDQILADENGSGDVYWMLTDHQNTVRDTRSAMF